MGQDENAGIGLAIGPDVGRRKTLVHFASALPRQDFHRRLARNILGEILVRDHDHSIHAALAAISSTTAAALEDVQHTSLSAFTAADVFT